LAFVGVGHDTIIVDFYTGVTLRFHQVNAYMYFVETVYISLYVVLVCIFVFDEFDGYVVKIFIVFSGTKKCKMFTETVLPSYRP